MRVQGGLYTTDCCVLGSQVLLNCATSRYGGDSELWHTDGSDGGTSLLKDINIPAASSLDADDVGIGWQNRFYYTDVTRLNNDTRVSVSDGTTAGTGYYSEDQFSGIAGAVGSSLLLLNHSSVYWSDGTAGDEVQLAGVSYGRSDGIDGLVPMGHRALLLGNKIYALDGTDRGTTVVMDSLDSGYAWRFTTLNDNLAFMRKQRNDSYGTNARELGSTDGTQDGTRQLLKLSRSDGNIDTVMVSNGLGYFLVCENLAGNQDNLYKLWQSDGTIPGTVQVAGSPDFESIKSVGSNSTHVLFTAVSQDDDATWLWSYDTVAFTFTRLVKVMRTGEAITHRDVVFFAGLDDEHGTELWRSDGTAGGTWMTRDLNPGSASGAPRDLTSVGNLLLFAGANSTVGYEPYALDNPNGTPWLIQDIHPGPASSTPRRFTLVPGLNTVFFFADNGSSGQEVWKMKLENLQPFTAATDWNLYE